MNFADWNFDAVADQNARNLKDLDDGGQTDVWAAMKYILIGPNHPHEYYELVNDPDNRVYHGQVVIEKGGVFDPGSLTFTGIPTNWSEIEQHVAGFSKKKCIFN